jgi:LmbE family N-acetylglucosaminyl deacetylase
MTTQLPENENPSKPWLTYKRVLVVMAHPDDAEFGCGGTLSKLVSNGMELAYLVCTNGNKGSNDLEMTSEKLAVIREAEQRGACSVIGAKEVTFLGYGDGELEASVELIGKIVKEIRKFKPDIIICQDPWRSRHNHRDHRNAGQATFDAVYPYARDNLHFPEQLAEGLEPHKVLEIYATMTENPDVIVNISDSIHNKIKALKEHKSQIGDPHLLEERILYNTSELAKAHGLEYAEGFKRHTFSPGRAPIPKTQN